MPLDIEKVRASFPSLFVKDDGAPRIYFDNPGGTQVPRQVIDRTSEYFTRWNANSGGPFRTSVETDRILDDAHAAMADLVGAASPDEIVFGQNMTSLTFAMSRTLGRRFRTGDRILVTRMDHDANVAPWLLLARDLGLEVDWLPFSTRTFRYEMERLDDLVGERTVLAAVNYASNALGTINDVAGIARRVHAVGGLVYVDAVQYVPHGVTDVRGLDCDFLACSAYKFFGPHQGILWGREEMLGNLAAYKVRPASDDLPVRHETGTLSHEGMAGTAGAVDYLAWIGTTMAGADPSDRRSAIVAAMTAVAEYERDLCRHLVEGLGRIPGLRIHGITDPGEFADRVPTVVFEVGGHRPRDLNRALAAEGIFAWDGNYYALEVMRSLGFESRGGLLRVGLAHYNTEDEIDRVLDVLSHAAGN
jgi:cysteine desulfurase family protein (TIGR01976 family)